MELHKLPTIDENLTSMAKSIERLGIQAEKQQQQQQLMLKYMEGLMKEKSTLLGGQEGSSSKEPMIDSLIDGGILLSRRSRLQQSTPIWKGRNQHMIKVNSRK